MPDDLYERDFYDWTQAQGAALRLRGAGGNALDYENLAEEIETLGRSERAATFSYIERILQHFFKLTSNLGPEPRPHWRQEIRTFRKDVRRHLTQSILNQARDELESLHQDALELAVGAFEGQNPPVTVDGSRRWTLEQVLGEIEDPLQGEFRL